MSAGVRHSLCRLLAAGFSFALACGICLAEDTLEARAINTSAKPPKDEATAPIPKPSTRPRLPASLPPVAGDPLFEIERLWREAFYGGAIDTEGDGPVRGDAKELKPLEWRFPKEEPPPTPKPPAPSAGTTDPEQPRVVAENDDSDAVVHAKSTRAEPRTAKAPKEGVAVASQVAAKPLAASPDPETGRVFDVADSVSAPAASNKPGAKDAARIAPPPADPEVSRFSGFIDAAEGPGAQAKTELKPVAAKPAGLAAGLQNPEASPRIVSGGALDQDDPKPVLPDLKEALAKRAADEANASTPAPAPASPTPNRDSQADLKSAKAADADARGKDSKSKQKDASNKAGANDDPEEKFTALVRENKELMRRLSEKTKAVNQRNLDVTKSQLPPDLMLRPHELKVIGAMLDKLREAGSVIVTIFDPVTKQPLIARVRLVDATETTARAPLPSGFWCRGVTPAVHVISGPVLLEVYHGGRFFPMFRMGLEVKPGQVSRVEVPMGRPTELDFEARGWVLADFDIGLRRQQGENAIWFGPAPTVSDLILAAKCEGVRIVGVTLPLGDEEALASIRYALEHPDPDVLLLPVFPGPRNLFNGSGMGLGVTSWEGLRPDSAIPEIPLREGFEAIRAREGLAVFKDLKGLRSGNIERELFPVYRRLKDSQYFGGKTRGDVPLYACGELPFDTLTGAFDVLALDGTDAAESVWFNLLNEGAEVRAIGAGGGSLQGGRIPFGQTFVQLDGKPTREKVLDAVKGGRTMVSFGPAVFAKVFERDMGPGAVLPSDGRELSLQVQAYSAVAASTQLDKIEIIRNGRVVYTQAAAAGETEIHDLRFPLKETGNAWYVVRVTERHHSASGLVTQAPRRAWTSPIFFRGTTFAAPAVPNTRVHGVLRKGLTPMRGVVTALAAGMPTRRIETGPDGAFELTVPCTAALIFEAPDCEPLAKRIFEHPRVQRGIGTLTASDDLIPKLADRAAFGMWRGLMSDLDWDVVLTPMEAPAEPQKLPEPE